MISARNDYRGFQGLNTDAENFPAFVMSPMDIRNLIGNLRKFEAIYAYPPSVADAFKKPPVFSAKNVNIGGFLLSADIHTNTRTHGCLTWFASKIMPRQYTARDYISFYDHPEDGFGEGSCHITTQAAINADGDTYRFATNSIAVKNRPALFFRIQKEDGSFYHNAAIFFPAQVSGLSHQAVRFGEAFVLAEQHQTMPDIFASDVKRTFDLLVKKSYGEENGLRSIPDYLPIEDEVLAVPGLMI